MIKNYLFNNLAYKSNIWYWSIVAQYGAIKIDLFQKGLNSCSFQGFQLFRVDSFFWETNMVHFQILHKKKLNINV